MNTSKFHIHLARAAFGIACLGSTIPAFAGTCAGGLTYQTVDYFKPAPATYPTFINQGSYHLSLCNTAHGTLPANTACSNIDLKGYLYEPASGTTKSALPLVVWVDGSFANDANPAIPQPADYPTGCPIAAYFTSRGYSFLAVVRRGYRPSTGENEVVREANSTASNLDKHADSLNYLANEAFEVQEAINYMTGLKAGDGKALINAKKIGYIGHSLGGIVGLYFGTTGNKTPIMDAGIKSGLTQATTKVLLAPGSQSWDSFDLEDGVYDDTSPSIERLKTAAQHSLLPTYFLEPLNDQSYRPAAVLGKAASDYQLAENQACREAIRGTGPTTDDETRRIVDTCPRGREYQSALFPVYDISGQPDETSAHGPFTGDPSVWGPSAQEFLARHGVKP